jgi:hypothetical protein
MPSEHTGTNKTDIVAAADGLVDAAPDTDYIKEHTNLFYLYLQANYEKFKGDYIVSLLDVNTFEKFLINNCSFRL